MPWVKLNNNQAITRKGVITMHHAGDWVNVGRQTAEQWVAGGNASMIDPEQFTDSVQATAGIVIRGPLADEWRSKLNQIGGLQLAFGDHDWTPGLPFTETLIWHTSLNLRLDLLMTGFMLLKRWQVVVPLYDYTTLASHIGTDAERDATAAIIRDLRVPVRDTRLLYVRRSDTTRELMTVWREALTTCREERLAFMQAMYTVKPLVCDVPASWAGKP